MNCPACGEKNDVGAGTCSLCGGALPRPQVRPPTSGQVPAAPPAHAPIHPPVAGPPGHVPRLVAVPVSALPPATRGPRHLLVRLGFDPLALEPGKVYSIGRDPTCWLSIPGHKVSRYHAEIRWDHGRPILVDLGSQNGTTVGGRPIKEHALISGDEIQIGPLLATYELADPARVQADAKSVAGRYVQTVGEGPAPATTGAVEVAVVAEVLQGLELHQKTGTLSVFDKGVFGWLTIQSGAPGAAELRQSAPGKPAPGAPPTKVDDEAVMGLLGLTEGRYVFEPELKVPDRRMSSTITALLLEWGRRQMP